MYIVQAYAGTGWCDLLPVHPNTKEAAKEYLGEVIRLTDASSASLRIIERETSEKVVT